MAVCNNLGHVAAQRGKIKHAKVVSWCRDTAIKIEMVWKNHGSDESFSRSHKNVQLYYTKC